MGSSLVGKLFAEVLWLSTPDRLDSGQPEIKTKQA